MAICLYTVIAAIIHLWPFSRSRKNSRYSRSGSHSSSSSEDDSDSVKYTIYNCVNGKCQSTLSESKADLNKNEFDSLKTCQTYCLKVGDSVKLYNTNLTGCVTNIEPGIGMIDVCTGKFRNNQDCDMSHHTNIRTVEKIPDIKIGCEEGNPGCEGERVSGGCYTVGEWPHTFDTKQDCLDWTKGKNTTWGSCVSFPLPYSGDKWTIGCQTDQDCHGNRKCIGTDNLLNKLHKTCSCSSNDDCSFPINPPNSPSVNKCKIKLINGKMKCPK